MQKVKFMWLGFLIIVLVVLIAAEVYVRQFIPNANFTITFTEETPTEYPYETKLIYVSGAVNSPGLYRVPNEARLGDVLARAGGLNEDLLDRSKFETSVNLADKVSDGQAIRIPAKSESSAGFSTNSISKLISINSASVAELEKLPGVGASTAEKIIENRPYASIQDLLEVPGIGEAKLAQWEGLISL